MSELSGRVLVTGASGFIGYRLVETLLRSGSTVRILMRREVPPPPPGFEPFDRLTQGDERFEVALGDITDAEAVLRAMRGCDRVFHLAACAKNWARDKNTFFRINVEGMRNVFQAALQCGVQRIVWTSTIVTLGPTSPGVIGNEDMPRATTRCFTEYEESKMVAEQEALRLAGEGLPLVIVNPTRVYGPGYLTEGNALTRIIDQYRRGRFPVLLGGGVNVGNYVFVEDVVRGHLLAMQRGRVGQRYILGGENASLREFFRTIDEVGGGKHVQWPVPGSAAIAFAWLQKQCAQWLGIHPSITPGWVRTFLADWAFGTRKAEDELGYRPTPLREGLRTTCRWLDNTRGSGQ